jgi:6-phosphogluconolactonase (cycloisomerase 2 family)
VLADQEATNGSRPISVTSTTRGRGKQLLYVLNSDVGSANIQGYYVSANCTLTDIPGSNEPTSSPDSLPAAIRFDQRGRVLAVSERFANGIGDIDIFPVDRNGVAGAPVVAPSTQETPYGLDWSNQDVLSVTNEHFPPPVNTAGSTVATYSLADDGTLTLLATASSPGAACWNLFTNDGRFLYTSNPIGPINGGANVDAFRVDRDGSMTLVDQQNTPFQSIDNALSHDSRFLYVLSDSLLAAPASAISEYAVNPATGALTPIGSVTLPGNTTSGLAAW